MTQISPSLENLSLAELDVACKRETQHYRLGRPSDARFCLEIFRRALQRIKQNPTPYPASATSPHYVDEQARTLLIEIYTEFVKATINRKVLRDIVLEDVIQQVWLRFWRAANNGLEFPSLEGALTYLKLTTVSTLIELRRAAWEQRRTTSISALAETTGEEIAADTSNLFDEHAQARFRERCRELLTDPLDRRIFWMRYSMGMPPREIARELTNAGEHLHGRTPTARIVSDALERMCRQLKHDEEIRDLLQAD